MIEKCDKYNSMNKKILSLAFIYLFLFGYEKIKIKKKEREKGERKKCQMPWGGIGKKRRRGRNGNKKNIGGEMRVAFPNIYIKRRVRISFTNIPYLC